MSGMIPTSSSLFFMQKRTSLFAFATGKVKLDVKHYNAHIRKSFDQAVFLKYASISCGFVALESRSEDERK